MMEMPRDYMKRCAQRADRVIFEYRDELIVGMEDLRYIGFVFASEEAARAWDDHPRNLRGWWAFDSWEDAEFFLHHNQLPARRA